MIITSFILMKARTFLRKNLKNILLLISFLILVHTFSFGGKEGGDAEEKKSIKGGKYYII